MSYTTLLFDVDETLYPSTSGLWDAIAERIDRYMADHLCLSPAETSDLRLRLFHQYGTTLRGLKTEFAIDELDFLRYVHDVPLANYIAPDPRLPRMIARYPLRKVIFTNADVHHARRVLAVLGLEHSFERIIDILDMSPYCKPQPEAFRLALHELGGPSPAECIFIDDGRNNILAAREFGFYTIWVRNKGSDPGAHAVIDAIQDLPSVLDPLLNGALSGRKGD